VIVMSRRQVQVALGVLWILDGALQLQPFMFGRGFAEQVIAPAGEGQPGFVSSGVQWAADLVVSQPVAWDLAFAAVQLAIGLGLLVPRTVRPALSASLAWSAGVWFFGEGLGGLASGHADLLTGAPGAVLLYAVLALGVWPHPVEVGVEPEPPARWLPMAWAVVWVGGAALQLLPGQNRIGDVTDAIRGNADDAPAWLAHVDHSAATTLAGRGVTALIVIVVVQGAIGLAAIPHGVPRSAAGVAGIVVSLLFWVFGQSLGELWSGQSTDPNSAPLLVLLALAMMASPAAVPGVSTRRHRGPQPMVA
jgi:hypothetical protein